MQYPRCVVDAAKRSKSEGDKGIDWVYFQGLSQKMRDAVEGWIIITEHPLGEEPGTTKDRFYSLVRECAAKGDFPDLRTTLTDEVRGDNKVEALVETHLNAIELGFDQYSECGAADGYGRPVRVELYDGELRVLVWADINQEDPTHIIPLAGAHESKRESNGEED